MRHPGWALSALFVLIAAPLAVWQHRVHASAAVRADKIAHEVPQQDRAGYATSAACEACHPSQYHSWQRGYHHTMTQYASPQSVKGNFDDVSLSQGGYDVKLSREGDDFMVEMVDPLWQYEIDFGQRAPQPLPPRVKRRVSLVTGSHHMQAYWLSSEVGNGQLSLPFTYLFDDHRWVPRGEVFLHPPTNDRHQLQVWNVSCIRCHSTGGQPLALVGGKEIQSKVAEIGIACEACHGPAAKHVDANQSPWRRYLLHLRGGRDDTIVNPAKLPADRSSQVCGQCHSITEVSEQIELGDGKPYVPGDDLEATMPLIRPIQKHVSDDPLYMKGYFWADGTIRVSSRDYSGLIESKCMQSGKLACTTCHSLHDSDPDGLVAEGADGDGRCVGCHPKIDATHTHHAPGSAGSRCYNCHMPRTVYGLLKAIRNHRIDSPHVTGSTGGDARPNACNLCHVDKSLAWTAKTLGDWYKQPVVPGLSEEPAAVEWLLSGDAVLRAIAAWHLGEAKSQAAVPYLVAELADPYSAVRYVAIHALEKIDARVDVDYLASGDERKRAGDAIIARWAKEHPELAKDENEINARILRLVDKRDDTPVRAME
jgi:predicted CXXCH cytochrome family protein